MDRFNSRCVAFAWVAAAIVLGGCGTQDEGPLVSVTIPADPHAPVVADVTIGTHVHRLLVDTGASGIFLDIAVAQRLYAPLATAAASSDLTADGLHGQVPVQRFATGRRVQLGDWRFESDGSVDAIDMSHAAENLQVEGVLGMGALSRLDWLWDNQQRRLSGFAPGSVGFAQARRSMTCVDLLAYDGIPGLVVDVQQGRNGVLLLDTGDLMASGGLSEDDLATLTEIGAVEASIPTATPQLDIKGAEIGHLHRTQLKSVSLAGLALDGLVLHSQRNDTAGSRLGRGFLAKFDRVALDFRDFKFCFPADSVIAPDRITDYR